MWMVMAKECEKVDTLETLEEQGWEGGGGGGSGERNFPPLMQKES